MLTKVCTKCGIEKTVDCFSKQRAGKYGVTSTCKPCNVAQNKHWQQTNREKAAASSRRWQQTNPEKVTSQRKIWKQANPEKVAAQQKRWKQRNPEKVNAAVMYRKARRIQATPSWANQETVSGMYQLAALFNSTGMNIHVDHIIPLQSDLVCGLHCESNLQLLSANDNLSKGNHWWPDMW